MKRINLEIAYDPDANAGYARLNDGVAWEGEEVAPGLIVHFDKSGRPVALEFVPASAVLDGLGNRTGSTEAA